MVAKENMNKSYALNLECQISRVGVQLRHAMNHAANCAIRRL
jgi:hypothetical protein